TITWAPSASPSAGATVRAVISTLPLGGQGTTTLTGWLGKLWATTHTATATHAAPASAGNARFMDLLRSDSRMDLSELEVYASCLRGSDRSIWRDQHARRGKSQSVLATGVHELPEDEGIPHQERGRLRVDQRAQQSSGHGGAAQARRAERPRGCAWRQV